MWISGPNRTLGGGTGDIQNGGPNCLSRTVLTNPFGFDDHCPKIRSQVLCVELKLHSLLSCLHRKTDREKKDWKRGREGLEKKKKEEEGRPGCRSSRDGVPSRGDLPYDEGSRDGRDDRAYGRASLSAKTNRDVRPGGPCHPGDPDSGGVDGRTVGDGVDEPGGGGVVRGTSTVAGICSTGCTGCRGRWRRGY